MKHVTIPINAITHGGTFHADDVFTYAFLRMINPVLGLKRVFNITYPVPDSTIVFDIGEGRYDHHQNDNRCHKGTSYPMASFGRVYADYAKFIISDENARKIFEKKLVIPIDMHDCNGSLTHGIPNELSVVISSYNKKWDEFDCDVNSHFLKAAKIAEDIIQHMIDYAVSESKAIHIVEKYLKQSKSHTMFLDKYVPYQNVFFNNPESKNINWVGYPSAREGYQIFSVMDDGENRQLIPSNMVNKMKTDKNCIFVHPKGFTAVFKHKEDSIKYLKILCSTFDEGKES